MLKSIFGDDSSRFLKKARPIVEKTSALESAFSSLTPEDFPKKTEEFKKRLANGETLEDILPDAFALVREAAKKTLNQRPFDVQILGGVALHRGMIVEMKTGEGKTLVATLPIYLNALVGKGAHVVTVNDYLARRDAVWMGQIYAFLGFSTGVICSGNASYLYDPGHIEKDELRDQTGSYKILYDFLRPCSRAEAYAADITYGMGSEFGFDYLRDNLAHSASDISQRDHNFAIVDEVDSILIDEARTPLIISMPAEESEDFYKVFARIAEGLQAESDFEVDEKRRAVTLTSSGIEKAERALKIDNIYTEKGIKYVHHLETATRAKALYLRDRDYVVRPAPTGASGEGEVVIVDPFTGRMMPGRRWSEGLHQAIEAKEGVKIERETRAAASITYQNYFRMYEKLSGMTGTAKTSSEEFDKVYGLQVVEIPTNRPMVRADKNDLIFQTETGKFTAVARTVKELHQKGQPVLLGTVSIEKNELLSEYLKREGVPHEILNAKNHEREGEIIAQAGRRGAVTIATNMAGRGVDIKLGGATATPEEHEEVKKLGGLFVLGTERHEARRIDNQLRGRAGRQGDLGATQFFVSLEDNLMRVFGGEGVKKMMGRLGVSEDTPIENRMITKMLESAQERIEGFNFDARKHTLEYDDVLNHQRKIVYDRRRIMINSDAGKIMEFADKLGSEDGEFIQIFSDKKTELGEETALAALRRIILYVTDVLWMEHLESMEYLRSSVGLRAYGQRDPLVEYKKEGLRLFHEMEETFRMQVKELLKSFKTAPSANASIKETAEKHAGVSVHPTALDLKIGRNDPCPCGSGKKYKKCHGK